MVRTSAQEVMDYASRRRESRISAVKTGVALPMRSMHSSNRLRESKVSMPPPPPPALPDTEIKKRVRLVIETRKMLRRHNSAPPSTTDLEEHSTSHRNFLKAHIKKQLREDMFVGGERGKKVLPICNISTTTDEEKSVEEKIDVVLADPKFGMFSLFKYHWVRGYKNEELVRHNVVYCSHIFSLWAALPIVVFLAQWIMYIALVSDLYKNFDRGICPGNSEIEGRLLMAGVAMVYFVKSFFLWDSLVDRTRCKKMAPSTSYIVILDSIQEFGFNLCVYAANLWLVFTEEDVGDALLDSLAMEFLMTLDNQFMEMYISYLPGVAVDIYDNVFVSYSENKSLIEHKMDHSKCFRIFKCITWLPFKLLQITTMMFPAFCAFMGIYGFACK